MTAPTFSNEPALLQGLCIDAVQHLRRHFFRTGGGLESACALAFQRLFLDSAFSVLLVECAMNARTIRGAKISGPAETCALAANECGGLITDFEGLPSIGWSKGTTSVRSWCTRSELRGIALSRQPEEEDVIDELWIILPAESTTEEKVTFDQLVSCLVGLTDLIETVSAFQHMARLSKAVQLTQLEAALARMFAEESLPLSVRLTSVMDLVRACQSAVSPFSAERLLAVVIDVARWAAGQILGMRWLESADGLGNANLVVSLFCLLEESLERTRSTGGTLLAVRESAAKAELAAYKLVSVQIDWRSAGHLFLGEARSDSLSLLGRWTRLERVGAGLSREPRLSRESHDEAWRSSINLTLPALREYLARGWNVERRLDSPTGEKISGFGAWQAAWLVSDMLERMLPISGQGEVLRLSQIESALLQSDRWRLRAQISLLLREVFRQSVFGHSPDFGFDDAAYLEALSGVVEQHARFVLGLSWEVDLYNLLRSLGESRDADDHPFTASHLQHALQVYICGLFLADVQVSQERTLLGFLAAPTREPGEEALRELKQAFALAALFHDAGMLLFPRVFFPTSELPHGNRLLSQRLQHIRSEISDATQALMGDCERELVAAQYFDPQQERALASWIRAEIEAGRPDHSLLGAWYLHHIGGSSMVPEILRPAVRAVLLHQVTSQPIDPQCDPVAALLVYCDELMDWRPSGRPKGGLPAGFPDLGSRNLDVRREGSRARSIDFPGLYYEDRHWKIDAFSDGKVCFTITIGLQEPDHLTMPVYHIWLLTLQNLVRVIDERSRWTHKITISSTVPGRLSAMQRDHTDVLEALARTTRQPCRAHLSTWRNRLTLATESRGNGPQRSIEQFVIFPSRSEIWPQSLGPILEALAADYERVLRELK